LYRLLHQLTVTEAPLDAGDFRLMSKRAVEALKAIRERSPYVRGLASWVGFQKTSVTFVRDIRHAGESKYPLRKLVTLALDGMTSFSFVPLRLATYLGLGGSFISFVYIVYAVGLNIFTNSFVSGWALAIVAILFIGSALLITLDINGEYVGRICDEVRQRPLYLVDEAAGFDKTPDGEYGSHRGALHGISLPISWNAIPADNSRR
jgi:dolichol-phosphate mannosyltransferase